jgi:hypothetical protein
MRRCASRIATRRISWMDHGSCELGDERRFWGWSVGQPAHPRQHREGQHHQRDVPVSAVPRAALVVGQPELRLGGLDGILNGPASALHCHQRLDRRAGRAPGREVGQRPVRQAAPHQQAARPQALIKRGVEHVGPERRQRQISPIEQARPLGASTGREADPVRLG